MFLKKEQAKTKWCPLVRETAVAAAKAKAASLGNRYNDFEHPDTHYANPVGCRCIADECMAWRGDSEAGYCGAFGQPHKT